MTLCAISVDRYNVIVFPLVSLTSQTFKSTLINNFSSSQNPSRSTTNNRSRAMIAFVWIFSLPFFRTFQSSLSWCDFRLLFYFLFSPSLPGYWRHWNLYSRRLYDDLQLWLSRHVVVKLLVHYDICLCKLFKALFKIYRLCHFFHSTGLVLFAFSHHRLLLLPHITRRPFGSENTVEQREE